MYKSIKGVANYPTLLATQDQSIEAKFDALAGSVTILVNRYYVSYDVQSVHPRTTASEPPPRSLSMAG
jgi:hypothetical protein